MVVQQRELRARKRGGAKPVGAAVARSKSQKATAQAKEDELRAAKEAERQRLHEQKLAAIRKVKLRDDTYVRPLTKVGGPILFNHSADAATGLTNSRATARAPS